MAKIKLIIPMTCKYTPSLVHHLRMNATSHGVAGQVTHLPFLACTRTATNTRSITEVTAQLFKEHC